MLLELHEDILEDELLIKVPGSAYSGEKSTTADRFGGGCLLLGLHFLERVGDPQLRAGCRPHEAGSNSEGSWAGHTG